MHAVVDVVEVDQRMDDVIFQPALSPPASRRQRELLVRTQRLADQRPVLRLQVQAGHVQGERPESTGHFTFGHHGNARNVDGLAHQRLRRTPDHIGKIDFRRRVGAGQQTGLR